jgi:hypothetical protein
MRVSRCMNQITAAIVKLALAESIAAARPKLPAIPAVIRGAKKLMTRPQLKIDAAVERRWAG